VSLGLEAVEMGIKKYAFSKAFKTYNQIFTPLSLGEDELYVLFYVSP